MLGLIRLPRSRFPVPFVISGRASGLVITLGMLAEPPLGPIHVSPCSGAVPTILTGEHDEMALLWLHVGSESELLRAQSLGSSDFKLGCFKF